MSNQNLETSFSNLTLPKMKMGTTTTIPNESSNRLAAKTLSGKLSSGFGKAATNSAKKLSVKNRRAQNAEYLRVI